MPSRERGSANDEKRRLCRHTPKGLDARAVGRDTGALMNSGAPDTAWPHAPAHRLGEAGVYMVTAGTYRKIQHFNTPQRLDVLQRGLLAVCQTN